MAILRIKSRRKLTDDDLFRGAVSITSVPVATAPEPGVGVQGHIIQDETPVSYPQRANLRFIGAVVEDSLAQDATLVTVGKWLDSPADPDNIYYSLGNVGIGIDTPINKLHVNAEGDDGLRITANGQSNDIALWMSSSDYGYFKLGGDADLTLRGGSGQISSIPGKLGIGTDSPTRLLTLSGPDDANTRLEIIANGSIVADMGNSFGNGGFVQIKDPAGGVQSIIRGYAQSGIQAYFIAGNVGIGTAAPTKLLMSNADSGYAGDFILDWTARSWVDKNYVDFVSAGAGLEFNTPVQVATTFAGGNISLSGLQIIDNYQLIAGDRVLVKFQTPTGGDPLNGSPANGVYVAAAGAWARSTDMNEPDEFRRAFVYVLEGDTQKFTGHVQVKDPAAWSGIEENLWVQNIGQVVSAENGITGSLRTVRWGGTLNQTTTITQGGFNIIFNGGNLGLGVTSPLEQLDVANIMRISVSAGGIADFYGRRTGATNYENLRLIGNDLILRSASSNQGTGSADRITIKHTTGNVGIGTSAPSRLLHVAGAVRFSNLLTSTGTNVATLSSTGEFYSTSKSNFANNFLWLDTSWTSIAGGIQWRRDQLGFVHVRKNDGSSINYSHQGGGINYGTIPYSPGRTIGHWVDIVVAFDNTLYIQVNNGGVVNARSDKLIDSSDLSFHFMYEYI